MDKSKEVVSILETGAGEDVVVTVKFKKEKII